MKKRQLARGILSAVVSQHGSPSLHDLARATNASIPTLKHYFGDRSGAVAAALRAVQQDAAGYTAMMAAPTGQGLAESLTRVARDLSVAWRQFGVGALFAAGMAAGIADATMGPAYVDGVLEPTVRALEARLRSHAERGELDITPDDVDAIRAAALCFTSPLLVALLHQHELSGVRCRPLDLDAFIVEHVRRFTRAYGTS